MVPTLPTFCLELVLKLPIIYIKSITSELFLASGSKSFIDHQLINTSHIKKHTVKQFLNNNFQNRSL